MDDGRILRLAYREAMRVWAAEKEWLDRSPNNKTAQRREAQAYKEVEEIKDMLLELVKSDND